MHTPDAFKGTRAGIRTLPHSKLSHRPASKPYTIPYNPNKMLEPIRPSNKPCSEHLTRFGVMTAPQLIVPVSHRAIATEAQHGAPVCCNPRVVPAGSAVCAVCRAEAHSTTTTATPRTR